jgi:threonine aldolase
MIDLRSDTVTEPTPEMRAVMAAAPVGDDVIDIDPTVARLQSTIAEMLGKEAAMFMPSGSMTNQVAVRLHCRPGDEFICEAGCHIYNYEQGAFAQLSQTIAHTIIGERSAIGIDQLQDVIRPDNEHAVRTRMICLENTHNRGGGVILPFDGVVEICDWAHEHGLATHLDGARLFNAVVKSGISAADWAKPFDTISVCFSKGLGAPVGSALVGSRDHIHAMRRHRKLFGGGMRQSGIIAAGALYGLEHNIERLSSDHDHAQIIAEAIENRAGLSLDPATVDTNIIVFEVAPEVCNAAEFCDAAKRLGAWLLPFSQKHVRAVTHLHIGEDDAMAAGQIISSVIDEFSTKNA